MQPDRKGRERRESAQEARHDQQAPLRWKRWMVREERDCHAEQRMPPRRLATHVPGGNDGSAELRREARSHRSAAPREAPTHVAWPVSKGSRTGRRAADQEGASVTTMVQLDPETRHERKNEAVRIDRSRRFGGTVAQPSSSSAWCDPPMIKIPARNGRPHSSVNMRVRHAPKSCADCAIAT